MMTRPERIEYEILDCVLHDSRGADGYATTLTVFLDRLRKVFPDIDAQEFTDQCVHLVRQGALRLRRFDKHVAKSIEYQELRNGMNFFCADPPRGFHLHADSQSVEYFKQLSAFIDMPTGFKGRMETN